MLLICRVWCIGGARGGGSRGLCTGCKPLCPGRQPLSFRSVMQYQFLGTVSFCTPTGHRFWRLWYQNVQKPWFWKQIFKNFTGGVTLCSTHPITALGCARGPSSLVLGPRPSSCVPQQEQTPGAAVHWLGDSSDDCQDYYWLSSCYCTVWSSIKIMYACLMMFQAFVKNCCL